MKHFTKHLNSILNTTRELNDFQLDDTILKLFHDHKRVIFCTMGKSAFACRKIVYTARSFSLEWHDLDVCHAFHGDAGLIKSDDLLVFISKSGNTRETVEVAKYFRNYQTISITSNKDCKLKKYCDNNIVIPVSEEGSPFGYAPMASTSSYMIILHAILSSVIRYKDIKLNTFAKNHPAGTIGEKLVE
jgi:arabinose-5-phosphate isomerase